MTAGPHLLELTAERRERSGDVLRRLQGGPEATVSTRDTTGDVAADTWRRVHSVYLAAAEDFASAAGAQSLTVDVPFDEEPVAIDGSLAGRLLDIYAACGWTGVAAVGRAIDEHVPVSHVDPSGGTIVDPWVDAARFFRVTRNAVAIVVVRCLADLESRIADRVTANLDDVQTKIDSLRQALGIVPEFVEPSTPPPGASAPLTVGFLTYRATDTDLEKTYHRAMLEVVAHRDRLDKLLADVAQAEKEHRNQRVNDALSRSRYSAAPPRDSPRTVAAAARVKQLNDLVPEAEATLRAVQQQVVANAPALLLLMPVMRRHWSAPQMTRELGGILTSVEKAVRAQRPPPSPRWIATIAGPGGGGPIAADVVAGLDVPEEGFERHAVHRAVARFASEPEFVPLMVESLWADLLDRRTPRASFVYAVGTWYLLELGDHLMEREIAARNRTAVLNTVRAVSALVSLALIWIPPVSAAVRGAVLAVDLVLMAESLYGVATSYGAAGTAMGLAGAEGGAGLDALSAAARYCAYRRDVLATLPVQLAVEIAAIPLGGRSRELRRLLLLRSYYNDLQTLAAWDPAKDLR